MAVDGSRQKYVVLAPEKDEMNEKYIRVLRDGYISMDMAQNILVIKTVSGMAMAVAAAVDAMKWKEVVGCIAGDDTICLLYTSDLKDRPLLLFTHEWSIRMTQERNEGLILSEFGRS